MPRTPRVPCSLGLGSTLCVSEAPCGSERSKGSSEPAPRELLARVNCSFCAHHVLIMCAMRAAQEGAGCRSLPHWPLPLVVVLYMS